MQSYQNRLQIAGLRRVAIAALLLAGTIGAAQAQSAKAHLGGPSVARVATEAAFNGLRFAPNQAVTVFVRGPDGQEAGFGAVTQADGTLGYRFAPAAAGRYTVKVADSKGRSLARTEFVAIP
jgi:hypothetical protein